MSHECHIKIGKCGVYLYLNFMSQHRMISPFAAVKAGNRWGYFSSSFAHLENPSLERSLSSVKLGEHKWTLFSFLISLDLDNFNLWKVTFCSLFTLSYQSCLGRIVSSRVKCSDYWLNNGLWIVQDKGCFIIWLCFKHLHSCVPWPVPCSSFFCLFSTSKSWVLCWD